LTILSLFFLSPRSFVSSPYRWASLLRQVTVTSLTLLQRQKELYWLYIVTIQSIRVCIGYMAADTET
jgi:hypothetical protein